MAEANETGASFDVVVVGAGFSGLYLLHRLRQAGFSALRGRHGRRRGRHLVLEPLSRCALRRGELGVQLLVQPRARDRSGSGPSATPASPRSCATRSTWPTGSTCVATSASTHRVQRPHFDDATTEVDHHHTRSRRQRRATHSRSSSWPRAVSAAPTCPSSRGATRSPAPATTPALAARGCRLHGQAGGRHRHRLVGRAVDPADRRAGARPHRLPAHGHATRCRRTTARPTPHAWPRASRAATPTASRRAGRWPAYRFRRSPSPAGSSARPSAARASSRRGRRAT
jgi:hypothetical protein